MVRKAFSLIELVFTISIIAILSSFIFPSFIATKDDAIKLNAKSTISSIRSAIMLKHSENLLQGNDLFISSLDSTTTAQINQITPLFSNILTYPIYSVANNAPKNGKFSKLSQTILDGNSIEKYNFWFNNRPITFTYTQYNGIFDCDHSDEVCQKLIE